MRTFNDIIRHSDSISCHSERSEESHEAYSELCERSRDPSLSLRVTNISGRTQC
jgi:hypothetical protein